MNRLDLLLNLTIHRYDELNNRNVIIDNKNKSMIAFVGVLLSLEVNILPTIIKLIKENFPLYYQQIIITLILFSLICYLISIIKFISAVSFVEDFLEAPVMDDIIDYGKKDEKKKMIVIKAINSFKKCIENNNKIMENKTLKAKDGFKFLEYGVIITTVFILLFIIKYWR